MPNLDQSHPVILFDGVCNLCSSAVQFIIKRDKKDVFRFASLQSTYGQDLLKNYYLPSASLTSIILVRNGKMSTQSTAALIISRYLSGGWSFFYYLLLFLHLSEMLFIE